MSINDSTQIVESAIKKLYLVSGGVVKSKCMLLQKYFHIYVHIVVFVLHINPFPTYYSSRYAGIARPLSN